MGVATRARDGVPTLLFHTEHDLSVHLQSQNIAPRMRPGEKGKSKIMTGSPRSIDSQEPAPAFSILTYLVMIHLVIQPLLSCWPPNSSATRLCVREHSISLQSSKSAFCSRNRDAQGGPTFDTISSSSTRGGTRDWMDRNSFGMRRVLGVSRRCCGRRRNQREIFG